MNKNIKEKIFDFFGAGETLITIDLSLYTVKEQKITNKLYLKFPFLLFKKYTYFKLNGIKNSNEFYLFLKTGKNYRGIRQYKRLSNNYFTNI